MPILILLLVAALQCACPLTRRQVVKQEPVLYPPLPNRPRVQFLAAYSSSADVEKKNRFADFVLGKHEEIRQLAKPYGAVVAGNRIVVTDTGQGEIFVIDVENRAFRPLVGNQGAGRVQKPINVAVAGDGTIFVTDMGRRQVLAYSGDEQFDRAYGAEEDELSPAGIAVTATELFVCDVKKHEIVVFDRSSGEIVRHMGEQGREPGQLYFPTNIAIGPRGDIYVSEIGNFRVQQWTSGGSWVRTYGQIGDAPGTFTRPKGIAVDDQGRLYVVDTAFENVQIFDEAGNLLMFFGGPGGDEGNLLLPAGISVSPSGTGLFQELADPRLDLRFLIVVVSQYGARRVNVFGFGEWLGPERDLSPEERAELTPVPVEERDGADSTLPSLEEVLGGGGTAGEPEESAVEPEEPAAEAEEAEVPEEPAEPGEPEETEEPGDPSPEGSGEADPPAAG